MYVFLDWLRKFGGVAILAVVVLVSAAAVGVSLIGAWRDRDQAGTALYVTSQVENDPVLIHAYISTDRASSDEEVQCWFQVHNDGPPLSELRFEVQAPGFGALPFREQSLPSLPTNASKMFLSEKFRPPRGEPVKFNVTAQFSWKLTSGDERRRLVTLGPIVYREPNESRLRVVAATYVGYLKDLAIPIVIVALTIIGGRVLKDSELRRTARTMILERVRDVAEKHYLLLTGSAGRVATQLSKLAAKPSSSIRDEDAVFTSYNVLQFFRSVRDLVDARGGYILPDKDGEAIVAKAQDLFTRLCNAEVATMEMRTRAVAHVPARTDYPTFKDTAMPELPVRIFAGRIDSWLRSGDPSLTLAAAVLRLYTATLSYELNVAYFPFRDEWPELKVDKKDLKELERSATEGAKELAKTFRDYEKRQPRRRIKWRR